VRWFIFAFDTIDIMAMIVERGDAVGQLFDANQSLTHLTQAFVIAVGYRVSVYKQLPSAGSYGQRLCK